MKRCYLGLAVLGLMIGVVALAPPAKNDKLLVLEWAAKSNAPAPPTAVLIELGLTDTDPADWTGSAAVKGAKVVHREGFRFRKTDKLTDPDGWEAKSHRGIRVPAKQPQISKAEKIATVGVVLHLADIKPDASITLHRKEKAEPPVVALKDVLAGTPKKVWDGAGVVRLVTTATPVATGKTEDDFPAACYGPDGTLWVAFISYTLKDESRRSEAANLKQQPKDFKDFYKPEFGDQLFVKYFREGKWSDPVAVTGAKEDLMRCAIAANSKGSVFVIYSAHRDGTFNLFRRIITNDSGKLQLGEETRVFATGKREFGPETNPVACIGLADDSPTIAAERFLQNWQRGPAVAAGPNGKTALAIDTYLPEGDNDVVVSVLGPKIDPTVARIGYSSKFEARPSICYDAAGRLWIAYEEGPVQWGKDFGALDQSANPLYNSRSVRVVCYHEGKLFKPAAELPTSVSPKKDPDEKTLRYAYPKIGIDGKGRVWLTYRQKFGTRYSSIAGSYWITMARRLDGDHWTEPIEVHHSDGLLDSRPVLLPYAAGGLVILHNTDGRYTEPETVHNHVFMSTIDLPGEPVEPKLLSHEVEKKDPALVKLAEEEKEAVARIRKYRVQGEGKEYRLLRGEFHRHCEISWDGGPDGSLEDMFRYAIDAADLDWIGPTDHDNGGGREYSWWLTQKYCDAYHLKERFVPMFAYERSVSYPHGHRNCIFAKRGILTLPRLAEPDREKQVAGIHADVAKMLYRYLHEMNGICASHTSATGMGTDWRDNDPKVEPIVEIYQGDRNSYEYEEAPRAGHDPAGGKKPIAIGGWKPLGFIDHAFEKGYRLGFQSSSDHWSTHISFCICLAEKNDRESLMESMRNRRCYAATDNIIADIRSGTHLMGEEFKTNVAPALKLAIIGTKPIAQIVIVKDSKVVETIKPGKAEYKGEWTDPKPAAGVHYYYVRIEQEDGQLAWTSPMWIDYQK
jgi:hypothetical protein